MIELTSGFVLNDRYRIDCVLGAGAHSQVFRVEHVYLRSAMALKVSRDTPRLRDVLLSEAELLASLDHPAIVRVYDAGHVDERRSFMVTEWVDGVSLDTLMNERRLTLLETVAVVRRAAEALRAAHAKHVLHRDVKPENLMVPRIDGRLDCSSAKLIDFGVGDTLSEQSNGALVSGAGRIAGTPSYSAPEQASGRRQSPSTDIYSLGAVLHELVYGYVPLLDLGRFMRYELPGENGPFAITLLPERLTTEISLPPDPKISAALHTVLSTALHLDPSDRYESMDAMIQALEAVALTGDDQTVAG